MNNLLLGPLGPLLRWLYSAKSSNTARRCHSWSNHTRFKGAYTCRKNSPQKELLAASTTHTINTNSPQVLMMGWQWNRRSQDSQ